MDKIEAIVAVYGIPNANGDILTEQAALGLFDQLRQQAERKAQLPGLQGYHITDVRIEGDRTSGKVYATFESPESLYRLEQ